MQMDCEELDAGTLRVRLSGRLDTVGVDAIETRFGAAVAAAGRDAIIDLSGVSFVSSMGVRLLISTARAQRARGRRMVLAAAQPQVAETLNMVSLDAIIPMADDDATARQVLAQPAD